jgi:glutamate-ammonia-ligase adenylyltransferase
MQRLGRPMIGDDPATALVLAMGKFGGRELNYRSDLDIIFLYDHDGGSVPLHPEARGQGPTSNAHFFAELSQRMMKACNTLTPQGRLYEVDSRLRPSGRSGAAAVSLDELARWFAPDGPAAVWERQALLKARPVIGAEPARRRFAAIRAAAIWGRSWSAADVAEIRHNRLRMEQGATAANLKRGPGGVVDIEFLVQVLQLVHGAADPRLQTTETLAGLVALHDLGIIPTTSFTFLSDAYRLLRRIEGRLQLLGAKARHDFPPPGDDRRTLARLMGHEQADDLEAEVARTTTRVREEFDEVFTRTVATLA